MLDFLSEENIEIHKESVRQKKLKLSIIEKSVEGIKGANIREIMRQKLKKNDRDDALALMSDIRLHEIFFSSFAENTYSSSEPVKRRYGSEASFLNELYRECMSQCFGFVCVFFLEGNVSIETAAFELHKLFYHSDPILAIDVSEHAYFLDYGFDKERYLRSALPYLDLSRLK